MIESERSLFVPVETLEQDPKYRTCPVTACQAAGVCVPVTVTPFARAGCTRTYCCGKPVITPGKTNCSGVKNGSCSFTVSQEIRVLIPVEFGAVAAVGETSVSCIAVSTEDDKHEKHEEHCGHCEKEEIL